MNDRQLIGAGLVLLVLVVGLAAWVTGGDTGEQGASADPSPEKALLDGDDAGNAYQESLHQAIGAIRESCLRGWTDTLPAGTAGELVIDAIVTDGQFDRFELRAVDRVGNASRRVER